MKLLNAIAAALGDAGLEAAAEPRLRAAAPGGAGVTKPVLQLNPFPITLDTAVYANALSGRNPGGDRRSLAAFRELVDPVPAFGRSYSPSIKSTESVYETMLDGASVDGESEFAARVLSEAKTRFAAETFPRLDGPSGVWRPVYAVPEDWWAAGPERFTSLNIDLDALGDSDGPFATIGGDETLELRMGAGRSGASSQLSPDTKVHSIRMDYLMLTLRRPWLNSMLFEANDWFLSGEDAGFCSSGSLSNNTGALPLIPTGMLIGRRVDVSAE